MTSSTIGSDVFFAFAVVIISITTLLLLRYYLPLRTTPAYLIVPVFLALALPASIILLVPIDLASAAAPPESDPSRGIWLKDGVLLVLWRVLYWLTFCLTWFVLPLMADFSDSGFRTVNDRVRYALRVNARYQLTVLSLGSVGLVYIFLQKGIYPTSLKSLVMALAYAWGLILAIYLMGHGLVAIPKKLFRDASLSRKLRHLQTRAPGLWEKMTTAIEELDELEQKVVLLQQKRTTAPRELQEWIEELADMSSLPEIRVGLRLGGSTRGRATIPAVITDRYLADLSRALKRARHKKARFMDEWEHLKRNAQSTEAVISAASTRKLERSAGADSWFDHLTFLNPTMRYYLHASIIPGLRYFFSFFFAAASISIIWSEVIKSNFPHLSIVGLSIIHHPNSERGQIGFAGQVMAISWLLYMCAAALLSISEVKVWGNRALTRRNTYAESACWYACQVAKLTVPLSYNFITFVPKDIFENSMFYRFLGRLVDFTPLGLGFSRFFPIFIVVSVLANTFNLYGKVKNLVGFGVLDDDERENPEGYGTGSWREGRTLLARDSETPGDDLGLSSRNHSPFPSSANLSVPYSDRPSDGAARPVSRTAPSRVLGGERQPRRGAPPSLDEDEPGRLDFFKDFAHKVRNTIDTAVPVTMARPKWMSGEQGGSVLDGGAIAGAFGKLFGKKDSGGVRL